MNISNEDFLIDIPSFDTLKEKVVSYRKQCEIIDRWLVKRLDTVLPMIMQRSGIDTWIICNNEHNEDPVFRTLSPALMMSARRLTILIMHLKKDGSVERFSLTHPVPDIAHLYTPCWLNPKDAVWGNDKYFLENKKGVKVSETPKTQWECLGRVIHEMQPEKIGLDYSEYDAYADGLSHSLYLKVMDALYEEDRNKVVSAEPLCIGWLETRIDEEMNAYNGIVQMAHALIKEAYSSKVIHPGVTTNDDVRFWMMEKARSLGLDPWFDFETSIIRKDADIEGEDIIQPGDVLHCDIGFRYLGLCTDTQEMAYILKNGEVDAPQELKDAMATVNRLQDITLDKFEAGKSGNAVLKEAREEALKQGIEPCIYSHPLGFDGHAAGPTIGLWDHQDGVEHEGDYIIHDATCYSLELNAAVEFFGKKQIFSMESDIMLRDGKKYFLAGRQTNFHLIK